MSSNIESRKKANIGFIVQSNGINKFKNYVEYSRENVVTIDKDAYKIETTVKNLALLGHSFEQSETMALVLFPSQIGRDTFYWTYEPSRND